MTKTDCRLCVVAAVLLCHTSPLFSQEQKIFNQNASRSNHTRLSFASQQPAFVLRLTGDRISSGSDGLASTASFMPGIAASYYTGNWGIGVEYGSFNNTPSFDIETYVKNMQGFTVRDISSSQWKTQFLMAGLTYRKSLGAGLQAGIDVFGGMAKMKAPSYSIKDKTDGTLIVDSYHDTKIATSTDNPLFALKPALRLEWFPGQGAIGINVHASYLRTMGSKDVSTYYRDLSKVRFENASQQEIRAQVLNAPVLESRSKGPVDNIAFGAGVTIRVGSAKAGRQTQGSTFGEKVSAGLHREGIVHRDIAARNSAQRDQGTRHILSGTCTWNPVKEQGEDILTNESSDTSGRRAEPIGTLDFAVSEITAREAGEGMTTGRNDQDNAGRPREGSDKDGSNGQPSGKRIYKPVYTDNRFFPPKHDTALVAIEVNPLYNGNGQSGTNPMHESNSLKTDNPLYTGNGTTHSNPLYKGIARVGIILINAETGEIMAQTTTEPNGDFFFANVPNGTYTVRISGSATLEKAYDVRAHKDVDVAGVIRQGTLQASLNMVTAVMEPNIPAAEMRRRVEVLKSNKTGPPHMHQIIRTTFETGDTPTSGQVARPGNPIGGIIVKGGKNPGGSFFTTTTDRAGYFELNKLKEGNNRIILTQTLYFDDEATVVLSGVGQSSGKSINEKGVNTRPR